MSMLTTPLSSHLKSRFVLVLSLAATIAVAYVAAFVCFALPAMSYTVTALFLGMAGGGLLSYRLAFLLWYGVFFSTHQPRHTYAMSCALAVPATVLAMVGYKMVQLPLFAHSKFATHLPLVAGVEVVACFIGLVACIVIALETVFSD